MNRTLKSGFFFLLATVGMSTFSACASVDETDVANNESIGRTQQSLTITEKYARVMNECSQAMTGSWWTYNSSNWPTGETYATYAYTSSDEGAWNLLLDNTYNCLQWSSDGKTCLNNVRGWWTSCKKTLANAPQYYPCNLLAGSGYGDLDTPISNYTCQQSNCTTAPYKRGGQCKPFMNLVAYRSGVYQKPNYGFKLLPTDTCISYLNCNTATPRPGSDANMPLVPYTTLVPGDFLRQPNGHAAIVVRIYSSTQVVILDSNYVGGNGVERVASHLMTLTSLGAYRVLKCIYTGAC